MWKVLMMQVGIGMMMLFMLSGCQSDGDDHSEQREAESYEQQDEEVLSPIIEGQFDHEKSITLAFAGDVMAAGKVAPFLEKNGYEYPWQEAKPYFEESDIAMVNLETPVSLRGEPANKRFAYRSHPDLLKGMKWAGVDLVTLANNHTLDYGRTAFADTMENLLKHDIAYVGAGVNEEEAFREHTYTINGKTVSYVAFSRVIPDVSWYATDDKSGLASGYQEQKVYDVVSEVVQKSDITVVYFHWGVELADMPDPVERELAHRLIDLGADVIIGAHPHVLQGMEYYKGKLIAYSLGNFIFTMSHQKEGRQSAILKVNIQPNGFQTAQLIPFKIERGAVWKTDEEEIIETISRVSNLSSGGILEENGLFIPYMQ